MADDWPITPLPEPPSRADPANFADEADAFLGALPQFQQELNDYAANLNGIFGGLLVGTSSTSVAIGVGAKTFWTAPFLSLRPGMWVNVAHTPAPASAYMFGQVQAYNVDTGELAVAVTDTLGAGTFADWTISVSGPKGMGATDPNIQPTWLKPHIWSGFIAAPPGGYNPIQLVPTDYGVGKPALTITKSPVANVYAIGLGDPNGTGGQLYLSVNQVVFTKDSYHVGNAIIGGGTLQVVGPAATNAALYLDAAAGQGKIIWFRTGPTQRWSMLSDGVAEGGADAGSNLQIIRYSDAGAQLGVALQINRNNGLATFAGAVATNVYFQVYSPASQPTLYLSGLASQPKSIQFHAGAVIRWNQYVTADAGSNAGADFVLARFNDAGALIDTPLIMNRSSGGPVFSGPIVGLSYLHLQPAGLGGQIFLDGAAGQNKMIWFRGGAAGATPRWLVTSDNVAEGGSNTGSDFRIVAHNDAGAASSTPIIISRSTGRVNFEKAPYFQDAPGSRAALGVGVSKVSSGAIVVGSQTLAIPLGGYNADGKSGEIVVRWSQAGTVQEPYARITDSAGNPIGSATYTFSHHSFGSNAGVTYEHSGAGSLTSWRIMAQPPATGWDCLLVVKWVKGAGGQFVANIHHAYNAGGYRYTTVGSCYIGYSSDVPYFILGQGTGTTFNSGEWTSKADAP